MHNDTHTHTYNQAHSHSHSHSRDSKRSDEQKIRWHMKQGKQARHVKHRKGKRSGGASVERERAQSGGGGSLFLNSVIFGLAVSLYFLWLPLPQIA